MADPITTAQIGPKLVELGIIPEMCSKFSVHFAPNDCVRVECEYWMESGKALAFVGELSEYIKTVLGK